MQFQKKAKSILNNSVDMQTFMAIGPAATPFKM